MVCVGFLAGRALGSTLMSTTVGLLEEFHQALPAHSSAVSIQALTKLKDYIVG